MIRILQLLFCVCLSSTSVFAQSLYFKTGKNFTNYVFESSSGGIQSSIVKLKPDSGSFYEFGIALPFSSSRFSCEFGISLNELNSIVEAPSKSVKYKTEYVGLDNSVLFSVIRTKKILCDAKLGFGLQTMVFGKQEIGGVLYDLKQFDEFNGLFFRQSLGLQVKLAASNQLNFSVGYDYHYDVFNTKNNSNQSLLINNNQIKFGIYYKLDKQSRENQNYSNQSNGNNSIVDNGVVNNSKIDSDIKVVKSDKKSNTSLSSINNIEKQQQEKQSNKSPKNSGVQIPTSSTNALKVSLVETKINKVVENEVNTSTGIKNILLSTDTKSNRVDNKVTQSAMIVRQPSNNTAAPLNSNIGKPAGTYPNGNSNKPVTDNLSVNVAVNNLRNSNSKAEQLLQDNSKSANVVGPKNVKPVVQSDNNIRVSNGNSNTDVLNAILNRLNLIENKLNILKEKNEKK